jgi:hypothetical protein
MFAQSTASVLSIFEHVHWIIWFPLFVLIFSGEGCYYYWKVQVWKEQIIYKFNVTGMTKFIVGCILGDSHIAKPFANACIMFAQTALHSDYLFYQYSLFQDYCKSPVPAAVWPNGLDDPCGLTQRVGRPQEVPGLIRVRPGSRSLIRVRPGPLGLIQPVSGARSSSRFGFKLVL